MVAREAQLTKTPKTPLAGGRPTTVNVRMRSEESIARLAETFRALGDPTRAKILHALGQTDLCVCDLASLVGSSESAVSHQLRLLRGLRLVKYRRAGRHIYYSLADDHVSTLIAQGLEHVEERL